MSLTSQLKDAQSPVSRFFADVIDPQRQKAFLQGLTAQQKTWSLQCPSALPASDAALVGTACDYLLRSLTWGVDLQTTVAASGAQHGLGAAAGPLFLWLHLPPEQQRDPEWMIDEDTLTFGDKKILWLKNLWDTLSAQWIPQPTHVTDVLLQHTVVCALFESIYRNGGRWPRLLEEGAERQDDWDQLVRHIAPEILIDLRQLGEFYLQTQYHSWRSQPAILNPVFKGSNDVGGADADWIVHQTLWDLKTTKNPQRNLYQMVQQMIGYGLLDYSDWYQITQVGLYFIRWGEVLTWPLEDLLAELTGISQPLAAWRTAWQQHLKNSRE